ncbi:C40 family peptidase [Patescibacteria group bacterium]|nr:C40 family peptidase [Patescibacteria group bacterium]
MQFSYKWLQEYFEEDLPEIKDLVETLTFHSFEIEGVEKDDLIDIDVLPNRSHDCLCYSGIAREISVLTGLKLKNIKKEYITEKGLISSDFIALSIDDSNLVPRATKRLVQEVKIQASPDWLKEKLESIGQRSINNVVDITNYVMWETGQPVHAFDFDKIAKNENGVKEFNIRTAKLGEKITTLDGQDFELDETVVVISDKEKALDIAGTKGGSISGIDENTKNVVLSVCNFNSTNIRRTSRKLGLRTDASIRFENNISPEKVMEAMERLTQLIVEITGGKASEDILDIYPRKANPFKVGVSISEINRVLGTDLSSEEVENIFKRLGFEYEKINPLDKVLELATEFIGKPYKMGASVTFDAPNEFDCSSFTAYLFAQAGIGIPRVSVDQYVWGEEVQKQDLKAGDLIFFNSNVGKIYFETLEFLKGTKVVEGVDHVALYLGEDKMIHASRKNGENGEVSLEKLSDYKLFENIVGYRRIVKSRNNADETQTNTGNNERYVITTPHERLDLRIKEDLIEEVGRIYGYRNIKPVSVGRIFEPKINKDFYYINKIKNILTREGFTEVYTYTFGDKGNVEVQKPLASNLGFLRTNLNDGITKALELNSKNAPVLGLDEIKIFEIGKVFPDIDGEYLSLAIGIEIVKKNKKSVIARDEAIQRIKDILGKELNIEIKEKSLEGILEINLDKLIEKLPNPESYNDVLKVDSKEDIIFKQISLYPYMLRDIAVWVSNENTSDDLLNLIKENAGELLVQTKLFDTYAPEGENRTSYAFNLVFQSKEKTLTDEEINIIMNKITAQIELNAWEVR